MAHVFGTHEHEILQKLLDLLSKLKIEIEAVFSDDNIAHHDAIPVNILFTGKRNTWRIERKHLTFRTRLKRLARKTICYSKPLDIHEIVFGLLINVLEFGCKLF
ncbi:MAG: IS1 family transposase [Candidatus Bathyarchaeota archaeon]|nr:IS1 family transposase [Candidatus Termiticorpusculum sp.]MCL2258063.1 IS1 family transposase [Candidatus Termiticorpusculum sp.]MCL2291697.1 IS1 family transposase [Candidatus Termiticorpusculum sp.]